MEKVKENITEVKPHNRRNRERHVKERYENFIHIIKGKQPRKWRTRKWEVKKNNQSVYGGTENAIRSLESEKLNC
jgi:hypothetical protein